MPEIKPIQAIADKWRRVTPGRSQDYIEGISNPRRDWARETVAATDRYNQGITLAMAENRFARGVEKAGTRKWKENSAAKGPMRWQQGINLGANAYAAGFAPYRDLIETISLPPRGPRGDPANIERARMLAQALHELKLRIG